MTMTRVTTVLKAMGKLQSALEKSITARVDIYETHRSAAWRASEIGQTHDAETASLCEMFNKIVDWQDELNRA